MTEIVHEDFAKEIEALVKSGLTPEQISKITGISVPFISVFRTQFLVSSIRSEDEKNIPSLEDYLRQIDNLPSKLNAQKQRTKVFLGVLLAAMELRAKHVRLLTGLTFPQVKNIKKRNNDLGFHLIPNENRDKIRTGNLHYRLLESLFCAAYCRIVGMKEFSDINICAAVEAYCLVLDSLQHAGVDRLLGPTLAFKDMLETLCDFREKLKGFHWCPHCRCFSVTSYSKNGPHYTRDCPFCYFRDLWKDAAVRQEKLRAEASRRAKQANNRDAVPKAAECSAFPREDDLKMPGGCA